MGLKPRSRSLQAALRSHALSFPATYEEYPWGERVAKVKTDVFVYLGSDGSPDYSFTVKLPRSGSACLGFDFTAPALNGLSNQWISVTINAASPPPRNLLFEWIEESYRAVAPQELIHELDRRALAAG